MGLRLITPAPFLPLTVEEIKAQVRVEADVEIDDSFLSECIADATDRVSVDLSRQLITATYEYRLASLPCDGVVKLPRPPLQSVTSITYYDKNDDEQTLDEDDYRVLADVEPGFIYFINPPSTSDRQDAITITFVAGYGFSEDIPGPIKRSIRLLAADFYRNREGSADRTQTLLPLGVDYLLGPYQLRIFQ